MADFAPNFTPRLKLNYRVAARNHNFTWRLPISTSISGAAPYVAKLEAFLAASETLLWDDWTIVSTQYAAGGSEVFLPVAGPAAPTGVADSDTRAGAERSTFYQFIGRGDNGARGGFYFYGLSYPLDAVASADFRINFPENATISAMGGVLSEVSPELVAIDDSNMNWYPYVNVKSNDHWVHRSRIGA